jgi:hypothetical protein
MGTNIPEIGIYKIRNELQNYETHTTNRHSRMLAGEGIATIKFTTCSRDLPEKVTGLQPVCQLMVHYHIHNSPAPVLILSQINPAHTPHSTPRRSSVILSPTYASSLPSGLCCSRLPIKTLHTLLLSTIIFHTTCPSHSSRHDDPNNIL